MKNRTVLAFLAGFSTCAAALYAAGSHTPAVFFAFGALVATLSTLAALRWASAVRRAIRRHYRRPESPAPRLVTERRKCEPGTFKKTSAAPPSQVEADVASALKNFGANKTQAAELARQAIIDAGSGANFQAVMRLALRRRTA
jgi:hypothetical protein